MTMKLERTPSSYEILNCESLLDQKTSGLQIVLADDSTEAFLRAMRSVDYPGLHDENIRFVLMRLPRDASSRDVKAIASCCVEVGLIGKLNVICSLHAEGIAATIAELQGLGINSILEDISAECRFSDFTKHPIVGVMINARLLKASYGDPVADSVVTAMTRLAHDLALTTFASGMSDDYPELLLESKNIDYVAKPSGFSSRSLRFVPD